MFQIIPIKLN